MSIMTQEEKELIHQLFLAHDYTALYQRHAAVINEMLNISSMEEFVDYLEFAEDEVLDERIFYLYYSSLHGESLLIGGFEEDVTAKVQSFVKAYCPEQVFAHIQEQLQDIYIDIDGRDNLQEKIELCNHKLLGSGYQFQVEIDETYCDCAYFLSLRCE